MCEVGSYIKGVEGIKWVRCVWIGWVLVPVGGGVTGGVRWSSMVMEGVEYQVG